MKKLIVAALAGAAFLATPAGAEVIVHEDGTGFVGKGDVQLAFGWNNKALQDNAAGVGFSVEMVTEVSWICTNSNNQNTQERERTTTLAGLIAHVARERNQITGFTLTGFSGGDGASSTEGPPLNSCPSGPWTLTTPAGDPEVVGTGGVFASFGGNSVQIQ